MTIQDEGSLVGTAGSISTLNFVGAGIAAAVSGSTATITAAGGARMMMLLHWQLLWDDYKYLNGDNAPFGTIKNGTFKLKS